MHTFNLFYSKSCNFFENTSSSISSSIHVPAQIGCLALVELTKLVSVAVFLNYLNTTFLLPALKPSRFIFANHNFVALTSGLSPNLLMQHVVYRPLLEEILFRGMLLRGMHGLQIGVNYLFLNEELTDEEETRQKVVRICASALIWGGCHLMNSAVDRKHAVIQIAWSCLGGIVYGILSENYKTLSYGYLLHGMNNALFIAAYQRA